MADVTALVLKLVGAFWPLIAGAFGLLAFMVTQRRAGAKAERAKQAAAEKKARDVADDVENDVGAMTPEQRREALRKWSAR